MSTEISKNPVESTRTVYNIQTLNEENAHRRYETYALMVSVMKHFANEHGDKFYHEFHPDFSTVVRAWVDDDKKIAAASVLMLSFNSSEDTFRSMSLTYENHNVVYDNVSELVDLHQLITRIAENKMTPADQDFVSGITVEEISLEEGDQIVSKEHDITEGLINYAHPIKEQTWYQS